MVVGADFPAASRADRRGDNPPLAGIGQNSRRVCVRCARNLAGKVNISNDSTPQNKQKAVELVWPHIVCLMKRDG